LQAFTIKLQALGVLASVSNVKQQTTTQHNTVYPHLQPLHGKGTPEGSAGSGLALFFISHHNPLGIALFVSSEETRKEETVEILQSYNFVSEHKKLSKIQEQK
jgi:hypothetical protein